MINIIQNNKNEVIAAALLILLSIAFYSFIYIFKKNSRKKFRAFQADYNVLFKYIDSLFWLYVVFAVYIIAYYLFGLEGLTAKLKGFLLINNELFKVSILSIIFSGFKLYFFYCILNFIKNFIYIILRYKNSEVTAGSLRALISNLGFLLLFVFVLSDLGINWKLLVPLAGALGIGVGIGIQNIMNNYMSGFILLFTRRLKVGDVVEIEGNAGRAVGNRLETIYGRVESIDLFNTVVLTLDGIEIIVPNSQFTNQQVVNYSLSTSEVRIRIPFGVAYSSDPNQVKDILLNVAKKNLQILKKPDPVVWFKEMGESSLIFELLCWVNIRFLWKVNALISDIYFTSWYDLREKDINIPFPQNDV
ncbi:MAG: mechanosensitive ion channel family protein [Thermodesulfobacteriota bacterium]